jgi:UDPglucose--hexose-1-phosphate uridylyltransferase
MKPDKVAKIEFRKEILLSRMRKRDMSGEITDAEVPVEFRFDPLTGRTCRIVNYSLDRIIKPDLAALEVSSRALTCPFCAPLVERITPQFAPDIAPEGVIRAGQSLAFPNATPYDVYGVVVVLSDEHFVPLDKFDNATVLNALIAAQTYLKKVRQTDAAAKYGFIAWNYMPPSGASLVHPHLQCNAGYYPTGYQKQALEASGRYYREKGSNYWSDLVAGEKGRGERYVGKTGGVEWLTGFVPKGRLSDTIAVFPGKADVADLTEADLSSFAEGLLKVFRYIDELNLISFNMSLSFGFDASQFWAHARITPRGLLLYSPIETSDEFYYQVLQDENICILPPETAADRLRKWF